MRKIISIALIICFISTLSFASTIRPSAIAVEKWLKTQGKFDGAKISTQETSDGKYEITHWEVDVPKPTDTELEKIIDDYEKLPKSKTLEERVSALEEKVR